MSPRVFFLMTGKKCDFFLSSTSFHWGRTEYFHSFSEFGPKSGFKGLYCLYKKRPKPDRSKQSYRVQIDAKYSVCSSSPGRRCAHNMFSVAAGKGEQVQVSRRTLCHVDGHARARPAPLPPALSLYVAAYGGLASSEAMGTMNLNGTLLIADGWAGRAAGRRTLAGPALVGGVVGGDHLRGTAAQR